MRLHLDYYVQFGVCHYKKDIELMVLLWGTPKSLLSVLPVFRGLNDRRRRCEIVSPPSCRLEGETTKAPFYTYVLKFFPVRVTCTIRY